MKYELTCCGYEYDYSTDLHKGMKIPRCPQCGMNNPEGKIKEE